MADRLNELLGCLHTCLVAHLLAGTRSSSRTALNLIGKTFAGVSQDVRTLVAKQGKLLIYSVNSLPCARWVCKELIK